MRFPCSFVRYYGPIPEGEIELGDDVPPTTSPGKKDNILHSRPFNYQGWPAQRIAVAYNYEGAGTAIDVDCNVYFWEDSTMAWYLVNQTPVTLVSGYLSYFEVAVAIEGALTTNRLDGNSSSVGALEICVVPMIPVGPTPDDGKYSFAVCADMSSSL